MEIYEIVMCMRGPESEFDILGAEKAFAEKVLKGKSGFGVEGGQTDCI